MTISLLPIRNKIFYLIHTSSVFSTPTCSLSLGAIVPHYSVRVSTNTHSRRLITNHPVVSTFQWLSDRETYSDREFCFECRQQFKPQRKCSKQQLVPKQKILHKIFSYFHKLELTFAVSDRERQTLSDGLQ